MSLSVVYIVIMSSIVNIAITNLNHHGPTISEIPYFTANYQFNTGMAVMMSVNRDADVTGDQTLVSNALCYSGKHGDYSFLL